MTHVTCTGKAYACLSKLLMSHINSVLNNNNMSLVELDFWQHAMRSYVNV